MTDTVEWTEPEPSTPVKTRKKLTTLNIVGFVVLAFAVCYFIVGLIEISKVNRTHNHFAKYNELWILLAVRFYCVPVFYTAEIAVVGFMLIGRRRFAVISMIIVVASFAISAFCFSRSEQIRLNIKNNLKQLGDAVRNYHLNHMQEIPSPAKVDDSNQITEPIQ
jgi:hypothetical protein